MEQQSQEAPPSPLEQKRGGTRFVAGFCVAAVLLVLAYTALAIGVLSWPSSRQAAWIRGVIERQDRIAESLPPGAGRVLLVGGSAGLFGIEAEWMEHWLGQPVVNLHSYADLSLEYQLDRARKTARTGDTVVLSLEYPYYFRAPDSVSPAFRQYLWTYERAKIRSWPYWRQAFLALQSPTIEVWKCAMEKRRPAKREPADWLVGYDAGSLSTRGDMRSGAPARDFPALDASRLGTLNAGALDALKAFRTESKARGVAVVVAPPPHTPFLSPEILDGYVAKIAAALGDGAFFRELHTASPPRELFLDTPYHLRPMGRRIFTERLMERLAPAIGKTLPATTARIFGSADAEPFRAFEKPADLGRTQWLITGTEPAKKGDVVLTNRATDGAGVFAAATTSIGALLRQYPNHVFCMAGSDGQEPAGATELPEPWRAFWKSTGPRAAIFGTGKFAEIHIQETGSGAIRVFSPADKPLHEALRGMRLELRAGGEKAGAEWQRAIHLDGDHSAASATEFSIVIIDPSTRTAVESLTQTALRTPRWSLSRIE